MTTTEYATETSTLAQNLTAGFRALADMIEGHSELAEEFRYMVEGINIPVNTAADPKAMLAAFIRAAKQHGAKIKKRNTDTWGGAILSWGAVGLHIYAARDKVCERIVTGTETVTRTVPDPDALAKVPEIEVIETVETVEWICSPLLADARPA